MNLGGPKEIRTPNPLVANEVRYRCAMGPNHKKTPPDAGLELLQEEETLHHKVPFVS